MAFPANERSAGPNNLWLTLGVLGGALLLFLSWLFHFPWK
jgi:hypothetical protein